MVAALVAVLVLSNVVVTESVKVKLLDAITKYSFNKEQFGCENTRITIACADLESDCRQPGRECSCDKLGHSERKVVMIVDGQSIATKNSPESRGCATYNHRYRSNDITIVRCQLEQRDKLIASTVQRFTTTCGPKDFDNPIKRRSVKFIDEQAPEVICPVPEGTENDFEYRWYFKEVEENSYVGSGRLLQYKSPDLPVYYYCVIRNTKSNKTTKFAVVLERDRIEDKVSILWVVIPAILIVITLPLLYVSYLQFIGELDMCEFFRGKLFEDGQVDYMVTQTGGSLSDNHKLIKPRMKKTRKIFRKTLKTVSAAIDRLGSSVTVSASVVISLPITENKAKIAESKRYRGKRAQLLNSLNITPLFRRQPRIIKLQTTRPYENDPESDWLVAGIRKVERWQNRHKHINAINSSSDTIEPSIKIDNGIEQYKEEFITAADQLTLSNVPCTTTEWLEAHRMPGSHVALHPTDKFGFEDEIAEMAKRLIHIYLEAKPHKNYFPTVRKIVDPFQCILTDPQHPNHEKTKHNWEEFMDKLFIIAGDVGTFNKLSRRILERVLNIHGNPEKIRRVVSETESR